MDLTHSITALGCFSAEVNAPPTIAVQTLTLVPSFLFLDITQTSISPTYEALNSVLALQPTPEVPPHCGGFLRLGAIHGR